MVSVALQFVDGDGGRIIEKFPSNTTLWRILRKFESAEGKNLNITGRSVAQVENGTSGAGRIYYEMPSVNIVGRDCSTFGDLQKTLQQLGINNGTALFKLSYKKTQQPLEEAMKEIAEYFKEEEASTNPNGSTPAPETNMFTEAMAKLSSAGPASTQTTDTEMEDTEIVAEDISERTSQDPSPYPEPVGDASLPATPAKLSASASSEAGTRLEVYRPSSSATIQAAQAPHNEADFEPTPAHLRSAQGRLLNSSQNKRLPSDAEIARQEEEKAARLAAIEEIQVRIRLPDGHHLLATLKPLDTAAMLYDSVMKAIVHGDQPFKLLWKEKNGGTAVIPNSNGKSLVKHLGFSSREVVTLHWEDGASTAARKDSVLKPEVMQQAKELKVAEVSQAEDKADSDPAEYDKGKGKKADGGGDTKAKKLANLMSRFSKK